MSEIKQENENGKPKTSRFNRNVILILLSAFFMTVSQYVVSAYLPSYSTAFGMPIALATSLVTIQAIIPVVLATFVGIYADRTGHKKPLVLIGCAALMISGLGLLSTTSWPLIYAFRIVSGFGLMMFLLTAGMAVLAMAPEHRSSAIGYFVAAASTGALVAYGTGPFIYSAGAGIHGNFIAMVVFGALGAVTILPVKLTIAKTSAKLPPGIFVKVFKNPLILIAGLVMIILYGAAATFAGLCATFAIQPFVGLPIADLGYIFIPNCIGAIIAGSTASTVLKKLGAKVAIILYTALSLLTFIITAFVSSFGHTGAIIALFGLFAFSDCFTIGTFPFFASEILKRVPREVTMTSTLVMQTFQSAGQVLLPLIGGSILGIAGITYAGYQITWFSLAGIIAIGLVLDIIFVALLRRYKITETVEQKQ